MEHLAGPGNSGQSRSDVATRDRFGDGQRAGGPREGLDEVMLDPAPRRRHEGRGPEGVQERAARRRESLIPVLAFGTEVHLDFAAAGIEAERKLEARADLPRPFGHFGLGHADHEDRCTRGR